MLVHIDRDRCYPCGICEGIFPKAFMMRGPVMEVETSEVIKDMGRFLVCKEACPYDCIIVEDEK